MSRAIRWGASLVLVLGMTAVIRADEETTGTIRSVDTSRGEVVLKGVVSDSVYVLGKDATVWLDGARCKLGDLAANDKAAVDFSKQGERLVASAVRGLRKAKETRGTVSDVFNDKREITIKGTVKNSTYELQKGGTVYVDGHQGKLTDIRPGDQVLITYQDRGDHQMAADVTLLKRK
jgi:formylmethanofuran dehydrogenase subunit C